MSEPAQPARWDQPYLETCCRAALHRLVLAGALGRPSGLRDQPCLERLASMAFATVQDDGRFGVSATGLVRHQTEILKQKRDVSSNASSSLRDKTKG